MLHHNFKCPVACSNGEWLVAIHNHDHQYKSNNTGPKKLALTISRPFLISIQFTSPILPLCIFLLSGKGSSSCQLLPSSSKFQALGWLWPHPWSLLCRLWWRLFPPLENRENLNTVIQTDCNKSNEYPFTLVSMPKLLLTLKRPEDVFMLDTWWFVQTPKYIESRYGTAY